jgi:hypothetical protein
MAAMDADVWVLTETRCWLSPGPEFDCLAFSREAKDLESNSGKRWVAIWVRKGIRAEKEETQHDVERTACVKLTHNGRTLYVYGTVLPWRKLGNTAFGEALTQQREDWKRLRECDHDANFCLVGDLNESIQSTRPYFSHDARERLCGALKERGLTCLTGGENDPLLPISSRHASIDHICVSDNPRPKEVESVSTSVWLVPHPSRNCRHDDQSEHLCVKNKEGKSLTDHYGVMAALNF